MGKKPSWNPILFMHWDFNEKPSSLLAERIIHNYYNDISQVVIIYGDPRIGKSAYGYKAAIQVFNFLFGWDSLRRIYDNVFGYHPLDVIRDWRSVLRSSHRDKKFRENKLPMYIWDDGGVWLFNQDYNKPLVKAVMKYFQIIFTKIQCIVVTTPTPKVVTAGLRAMPASQWLKVNRQYSHKKKILAEMVPSMRYARYVVAYNPFTSPDLKTQKVWRDFKEEYDCRFPNDIYQLYKPEREGYLTNLEDDIEVDMIVKARKENKLRKKQIDELNKINPELYR